MSLVIRELHRAQKSDALNEEWLLLESSGSEIGRWEVA